MTATSTQQAVIYARVSDKSQTERGHGLDSQEITCREYAESKGYTVLAVFTDDFTGSSISREGLKALLGFLKKHRRGLKVIIEDGTRLARSLRAHFAIRDAITAAGGKLESPKRIYADDPEDDIVEVFEAFISGEHRKKNAEQTKSRMRARCLSGHWCLQLPHGYKYRRKQSKNDNAVIERDEPVATVIQNALEGFACGHLQTQAEVARFLTSHPEFPRWKSRGVTDQQASNILTNPLYAGYVSMPRWGVSLRPGHHPALIDMATFQRIQARLAGNAVAPERQSRDDDFALRGAVVCGHCSTRLTSYWAKGSHARYPCYQCRTKGCEAYGKAVPRAEIEGEFADLLVKLRPSHNLFVMAHKAFRTLWQERANSTAERKSHLQSEIRRVTREIDQIVARVVATDSETLIAAYERRIQELELARAEYRESLASCG